MAHDCLPSDGPGDSSAPPEHPSFEAAPHSRFLRDSSSPSEIRTVSPSSRPRKHFGGVSRPGSTADNGSRSGSSRPWSAVQTSSRSLALEDTTAARQYIRSITSSANTPLLADLQFASMPYRGLDTRSPTRPLVDYIPDSSLHVEDEDAAFYAKDDDYLIHPHWKAMIQRTSNRIPRRIKRYSLVYLVLLVFIFIGWKIHFGPKLSQYRQDLVDMEDTSKAAYGLNVRPHFKDMVYIKSMDEKHLPTGNKRLIVVGDVHGCREELEQLLKEVEFNEAHDHLILTGDIVAKGPDSAGVVALAQKHNASCVRGNHEDKLLLSIAETSERKASLPGPTDNENQSPDFLDEESHSHGADDYKLRKLAKQFSAEQIAWLKELPVILKVGRVPLMGEVLVVHAGLVPDVPLEQQDPFQVMNMRTIDLKTRMPSEERKFTEWEKFWNHQQKKKAENERQTVIYGHDAKRGKNIKKFSKGLDSNCVRGGHLSALVIDSEGKSSVTQVKCTGYVERS